MKRKIETQVVHGHQGFDPRTGAVSTPIYQSATFRHPGLEQTTGYDYSRLQNPTREELEKTIAGLEGGRFGFAFSSGMAAISSILKLFPAGAHLIVSDDLYGGVYRLITEIYAPYFLTATFVDLTDLALVEQAIQSNTMAIFLEIPTNPTMKVVDIRAISALAKRFNVLTLADSTLLSPYLIRPLELGADLVVHSASKYLGGHNDTLAGLVVLNDEKLNEKLLLIQKSEGAILAPFDSWLILRGIKTLAVRLDRQQTNALAIAQWLGLQPQVEKVYYAGLSDHAGYDLLYAQASGAGSTLSFRVKNPAIAEQILNRVQIIYYAESLGGTETLITYPILQTHAAIPPDMREKQGVDDHLLRLSVGLEHIDDLLSDLAQAMR
ncbi:MAG: PLP-dependent aspartate aminotransferase family protein [Eubacteriales bacterium]|nr:PLP-dependent aspartate aminotransferase family protein [Eubacteriales bacterium]